MLGNEAKSTGSTHELKPFLGIIFKPQIEKVKMTGYLMYIPRN